MYWQIGREIIVQHKIAGSGGKVVRLVADSQYGVDNVTVLALLNRSKPLAVRAAHSIWSGADPKGFLFL